MLPNWYKDYKKLIDDSIENYLKKYFESEKNSWLDTIKQATFYSTKWWKRIRSILALEFYLIFSKQKFENLEENDDIINFCIALELLHAYSLVHDDLPAMDNDEYRRWDLTVWKKFGEANAILVGDLLNSLAFELLWEIRKPTLIYYFWQAVWIHWMLWWQVLDLCYEKNPEKLTLENLIETHNKKTWALIEISVFGWILIANTSPQSSPLGEKKLEQYKNFWKKIGLAFQVKDDLLDVEWNFEETGKSVWDWEKKGFVYFLWLEETHKYLDNLILECKKIIKELKSEKLDFLINYIATRKK